MTTVTRPALLSAMAYMLQAAGVTPAELAQHMGLHAAPQPLNAEAVRAALARPVPARRALTDNDRRLIAAAGRDGITVAGVMELLDLQEAQAHRYCQTLGNEGHLIRAKKPGVRAMRCFARREDADAWLASDAPRVELTEAEKRGLVLRSQKRAAARKSAPPLGQRTTRQPPTRGAQPAQDSIPAPVVIAERDVVAKAKGEAIVTADTKTTRDTTKRPIARWQAAPDLPEDPRWPRFSSTRPGQHPDTGKAWGSQA